MEGCDIFKCTLQSHGALSPVVISGGLIATSQIQADAEVVSSLMADPLYGNRCVPEHGGIVMESGFSKDRAIYLSKEICRSAP